MWDECPWPCSTIDIPMSNPLGSFQAGILFLLTLQAIITGSSNVMGVVRSPIARIPEVHGEGEPLHAYFTHPFPRRLLGPEMSPVARQPPAVFPTFSTFSLWSVYFFCPLSIPSFQRPVRSMLVSLIVWYLSVGEFLPGCI